MSSVAESSTAHVRSFGALRRAVHTRRGPKRQTRHHLVDDHVFKNRCRRDEQCARLSNVRSKIGQLEIGCSPDTYNYEVAAFRQVGFPPN
jgi:hypothetical protein